MDSDIAVLIEIYGYLKTIYYPSNWAIALIAFEEMINISAGVYAYCNLQELYNTLAALTTQEGISEFTARTTTAVILEVPQYYFELV